jgi:hypothetical protein
VWRTTYLDIKIPHPPGVSEPGREAKLTWPKQGPSIIMEAIVSPSITRI